MKLPICLDDAKNGVLCDSCKARHDSSEITPLDVTVSGVLAELDSKFSLENASVTRAFHTQKAVVLVTDGNVGVLVGKNGRIVRALSERLGKLVRVVQVTDDVKKSIVDLIGPKNIKSINKVYKAEGREEFIVTLFSGPGLKVVGTPAELSDVLTRATDSDVTVK